MRLIRRAAARLAVFLMLFGPSLAMAQTLPDVPGAFFRNGTAAPTFAMIIGIDTVSGKPCLAGSVTTCPSSSGGGGGGGASVTATAAAPTLIEGSTTNNISADLKGGIRFVPSVPGTGAPIDLSSGTAGTPGGGVSSVQGVSGMVPVDTNIKQVNGAAPSLTNPMWIANAEAADVTGTFTNATQTGNVQNNNADGYAAGLVSIHGTYGTASGSFFVSDDGGTTLYPVICSRSDGTASETGYTGLTNVSRQWACPVGGNDTLEVLSSAVASGTVNVRVGVSAPPPSSTTGTISQVASSSGGSTPVSKQVAANTTSVAICASACTLYGLYVQTISATPLWLKLYNTAQGSVTCGTPTPVDRILIPASATGAGAVIPIAGGVGAAYGTALTACVTTGIADNDTGAPTVSQSQISYYVK